MSSKIKYSLLFFWYCSLIILFMANCIYLKNIKFSQNKKSVIIYKENLIKNKLALKMEGTYLHPRSEFNICLKFTIRHDISIGPVDLWPKNISVSIKDRILVMQNHTVVSTDEKKESKTHLFKVYFTLGRFKSLNSDEIEYLGATKFPVKISLDNFIFINDTAIVFDSIMTTSPKF